MTAADVSPLATSELGAGSEDSTPWVDGAESSFEVVVPSDAAGVVVCEGTPPDVEEVFGFDALVAAVGSVVAAGPWVLVGSGTLAGWVSELGVG